MSRPNSNEFCWNELLTPDTEKAKEFYCKMFGWTTEEHDMGYAKYTMFKSGDKSVAGMMQATEMMGTMPRWISYVCVDDIDEALKKAENLGAKVLVPSSKALEVGMFGVILDPTGAAICLWKPSQG